MFEVDLFAIILLATNQASFPTTIFDLDHSDRKPIYYNTCSLIFLIIFSIDKALKNKVMFSDNE